MTHRTLNPILLLVLTGLAGCDKPCETTIIKQSLSPDGHYSAVVSRKDCGLTAENATQISLLGPDTTPTDVGNVFIADDKFGTARHSLQNGPWVAADWIGPHRLRIRYATGARILLQRQQVGEVKITYKATD